MDLEYENIAIRILKFIGILSLLVLAYVFIGISFNGGRGWNPSASDFALFMATIIFVMLLQYAGEKNPIIGRIIEKWDILFNRTILYLAIFVVSWTLWLAIVMLTGLAIYAVAFYINSDFVGNLFKSHGIIIGELVFAGTLIISILLAIVRPLASKIPEIKAENVFPARE